MKYKIFYRRQAMDEWIMYKVQGIVDKYIDS